MSPQLAHVLVDAVDVVAEAIDDSACRSHVVEEVDGGLDQRGQDLFVGLVTGLDQDNHLEDYEPNKHEHTRSYAQGHVEWQIEGGVLGLR